MTIITTIQRLTNAFLSKIPDKPWYENFSGQLDDSYLQVFEKPFETISRGDLPQNRKQALILLMVTHFENPIQYISCARKILGASDDEIFNTAVLCIRPDIRLKVIAQLKEHRELISRRSLEKKEDLSTKLDSLSTEIANFEKLEEELAKPAVPTPIRERNPSFLGTHSFFRPIIRSADDIPEYISKNVEPI